jgi:hypothetical protein
VEAAAAEILIVKTDAYKSFSKNETIDAREIAVDVKPTLDESDIFVLN